ncbi:MAG: DUF2905 domain-containing protein [Anaerolineales bacterium]
MLPSLARIFLIIGVIFLVVGGLFYLASRLNLPLGRLPGDIQIQGKGFTCIFPLATSILISILLSIILTLFSRFIGRK